LHVSDIEVAVNKLHKTEARDCDNLTLMHILCAHPALLNLLKILFNNMLQHGVTPHRFGHSVIIPIVKDASKPLIDANNYRPISIIPIVAKVFESCLSSLLEDKFQFHPNQFGFVSQGGCSKALFSFKSCVDYFIEGKSNVFFASLDATKAFDRLNHFCIFSCLIEIGFPISVVKLFMSWYRNLFATVNWNNDSSDFFKINSGVPQGSLLGPKVFNIVMDKLLCLLENSHMGCHIGGQFAGAIAYADDLILLSASAIQLQSMLQLCTEFGFGCDIKFNIDKSRCGCVGTICSSKNPDFIVENFSLTWTNRLKYLGITFSIGKMLLVDCSERIHKFIASVCSVLRFKVKGLENVFANILVQKCLPVLFYGLDCIMLNSVELKSVCQAWNMAFKWLFNMKKYDSTRLLFLSNNTMSMKFLIDLRALMFYMSLNKSSNALLVKLLSITVRKRFNVYSKYGLSMFADAREIKSCVALYFYEYCEQLL
jgi:hypothetical protein